MPSIQETAYPRLKSNLTEQELNKAYTPTAEELSWAKQKARDLKSQLGLLILLKTFQRLNYFLPITEVPAVIINHIARNAGIQPPDPKKWEGYHRTGTGKRQIIAIRERRGARIFNEEARRVMTDAMTTAVVEKDELVDLINIAIEELVRQRYELPVFNTLKTTAEKVQVASYRELYERVFEALSEKERADLDALFEVRLGTTYSDWHQLKQDPGRPTLKLLREWVVRRNWLMERHTGAQLLNSLRIPLAKVKRMAAEAKTLDAAQMKKMEPKKRLTLALSLLAVQSTQVVDDIGEMLVKRMMKIHKEGKKSLAKYQEQKQKRTDALVATLRDLLTAYQTEGSPEKRLAAMEEVVGGKRSGEVLEECEEHLAYAGNNYFPFLWRHFKSSRADLFQVLRVIRLRSTSQDTMLEQAIDFLRSHQNTRRDWIPTYRVEKKSRRIGDWERIPLVDLSWVPEGWWRWISPRRRQDGIPNQIHRRHFEVCVFSQIMHELKSGDLYIEGSEKYSDYRQQLISWEEFEKNVATFSEQAGLPLDAVEFQRKVQRELESTAREVDASFPNNQAVTIRNGEPFITRPRRKPKPDGLEALEKRIEEKMKPINILDMLTDTEYWLNWTKFFSPISGHDSRLENPVERYLTTVFCYGCNLGPTQTARSLGTMDRRQIAWVNQRHITEESLNKAITWIINGYNKFMLPKYWGTGKSASADGTKWDLYEQNLLSEHHIRYGGYGGIGYYHVSDTYIALFSHFIPCGVWEGVYILDILMKNKSDIQPDTLHSDTQGQNAPVFGLAYLLGIELMPRIRNWKDLRLHRPGKESVYQHIDELFSIPINWDLIENHYKDMLRVVMSIKAGRIHPSTILHKLGTYSRKNRLYQAFRELGRAIRTRFLLRYMADEELRSTIQAATNKSESFNGFTKWLFFGGEGIIAENDREKQRKLIKYNHLVANCLIFYNVFSLTRILHEYLQDGNVLNEEVLADLSPYLTFHVNRFGWYRLDPTRQPPKLQFDIPIEPVNSETVPFK